MNEKSKWDALLENARTLYGDDAEDCAQRLLQVVSRYHGRLPLCGKRTLKISENDVFLIAYADMVKGRDAPLSSLRNFLARTGHAFSYIHILPFFPYSSDDGFSVSDYRAVNPDYGTWDDIRALSGQAKLMFDFVGNHVSAQCEWFSRFLDGSKQTVDFFIECDRNDDYSAVVRPRTQPLLTPFQTKSGCTKYLWTTFSADQIDLNYHSISLVCQMADIMLFYAAQGASALRLDAANYMWKQKGTSCSSLPQTHALIRLFRAVMDMAAPDVLLITETNVPEEENLGYLGDGNNEAQMVYQFALPPLMLHSFLQGDARKLRAWAASLTFHENATFFNFLSSHDGVGLTPVKAILNDAEIRALVEAAQARGGFVSYKTVGGAQAPYELNCTYYSLLQNDNEDEALNTEKFISAHAALLALRGVPAIYYHSLFGSKNDLDGYRRTKEKRVVNRKKFGEDELEALLHQKDGREADIFRRMLDLIQTRKRHPAFSPRAEQTVPALTKQLFAVVRACEEEKIIALINVSGTRVTAKLPFFAEKTPVAASGGSIVEEDKVTLPPYGYLWAKEDRP